MACLLCFLTPLLGAAVGGEYFGSKDGIYKAELGCLVNCSQVVFAFLQVFWSLTTNVPHPPFFSIIFLEVARFVLIYICMLLFI